MKITIEIPDNERDRVLAACKNQDPALVGLLAPVTSVLLGGPKQNDRDHHGQSPLSDHLETIKGVCCCFHLIARQLLRRHAGRKTIAVEDEYDVQDLLHAILLSRFKDIRPEEWAPSYAGGASRMDFLLKQERIVVEVKMTRKGLHGRELGEQLIVDIAKYKIHPDCAALICFVYDPEGLIINPFGIENDLSGPHNGLPVKVIIAPKGM